MSEYILSQIRPSDRRASKQMDALLQQEGIERDKNLDYSVGLFDEDYNLAATGSCFSNTLRCLAVSSDHQGEGLLNQVLSHLMEYQYSRGNTSLFLYTKCGTAKFLAIWDSTKSPGLRERSCLWKTDVPALLIT